MFQMNYVVFNCCFTGIHCISLQLFLNTLKTQFKFKCTPAKGTNRKKNYLLFLSPEEVIRIRLLNAVV